MTKENLGGYQGKLVVEKIRKGRYKFSNYVYGMEAYINTDDINRFINAPHNRNWGKESYSNDICDKDIKIMIEYLRQKILKYKTVEDVIKSRSKYKKRYLMQFPVKDLQEYINKKEDNKHVKVESCS